MIRMEQKKQIERLLAEGFRNYYPDFPKGKLAASESPDFILRTKSNHYLGIELTRLHPEFSGNLSEEDKKRKKREEEMVDSAREIFSYSCDSPLFVKILFSPEQGINDEKVLTTAAQAVQVIRKSTPGKTGKSFSSQLVTGEQLPTGINSILILHHPELEVPVWERANNLGISDNIVNDIRFSIHKKDEKLRLYHKQRLHLYWLLVIADRLEGISSYNLENKLMNHSFHSGFQHVFLYELMKERVIRLV